MPNFEFRNYTLDFTIEGRTYAVKCDTGLSEKILRYQNKVNEIIGQVKNEEKSAADVMDLCKDIADAILGDGAYADIFSTRIPNVTDCTDLVLFLLAELTNYYKKDGRPPQNRSQRRSTGKK